VSTSSNNSLEACIRALRTHSAFTNTPSGELLGDYHFSRGEFEQAIAAYESSGVQSEQIKAKQGWCHAIIGQFEGTEELLTLENCGSSSAELAVLAAVVAGGWNRTALYHRQNIADEERIRRRAHVAELIHRALDVSGQPDQLAFIAYMYLEEWYTDNEAALDVAARAATIYRYPSFIEWHTRLLRTLDRLTDTDLDRLLQHAGESPSPSFIYEIVRSALKLSRYDDAGNGLKLFGRDPSELDGTLSARIQLMLAYVELQRALDADPGAAVNAHGSVRSLHEELKGRATEDSITDVLSFACKLRLALAVIVKDHSSVRQSAKWILDSEWTADYQPDYSPRYQTMWMADEMVEGDFGCGYLDAYVVDALASADREKWRLLNALRHIENDEESSIEEARAFVVEYGANELPVWAYPTIVETLLSVPEVASHAAGRVIARYCIENERNDGVDANAPGCDYDYLTPIQVGQLLEGVQEELALPSNTPTSRIIVLNELHSILYASKQFNLLKQLADEVLMNLPDNTSALFYGALARQEMQQLSAARPMYERVIELNNNDRAAYWNLLLIHDSQGNEEAIAALTPALEVHAKGGKESWVTTRKFAHDALSRARQQQATTNLRAFVNRSLEAYPGLREGPIASFELSLIEAAVLIALLRATELDHSKWILSPFGESSTPFEPTRKFRTVLFDLAQKGVIEFAESTPLEAFTVKDGTLSFYLDKVQWRISPNTLALQRDVRDLARREWPNDWTAHAEMLAKDLAAEECVAYMEYLCEERRLDAPHPPDMRSLFRELLEHCSAGKCWYYIYSGVQSANDYRTKYSVARQKVTAMMLKRTQERGQLAIEKGWDTSYQRIRALPRSHLSAALHDVLTRWGERAFEEPIRTLDISSAFDETDSPQSIGKDEAK
jgi:tetratricopeptide (TPR) repeat protein